MQTHFTNASKGLVFSLLLALFYFGLNVQQAQAQLDTEFWFAPPELTESTNESSRRDRPIQLVISTLEKAASVQILQPADLTFEPILLTIPANSTQIVDLTPFLNRLESKPHNTVLKTGLYIKSTASLSVYYEIKSPNNTDIFALKGANANGKLFYTPFQTHWDNGLMNGNIVYNPTTFASFDIVATDDTTLVTVTPSKDIIGHPAGIPFSFILNRGQVYSCRAIDRFGINHPAGSKIESDKDVAVTVKDDMLQFDPVNEGPAADVAGDQLTPVDFTGTEYVLVKGGLNNNGDRVYVLATEDNTVVRLDGNPIPVATLQEGEQYELQMTQASYFMKASKRVYVWHISGIGNQVAGAIIPALICTGTNQIGFNRTTPNTYIINVITKDAAKGKFTLNGNPNLVPASAFQSVQGSNGWVFARITFSTAQIPSGTTLLLKNSSSELFHVGVTNYASSIGSNYGYFSNFSRLNLGTNRTLCIGDTAVLDAGPAKTKYLWSTGDTTRFVETLLPGTYWVNTLSGTQCPKSDTVRVKFYEPTFNIGPDDTICTGASALIQPDGVFTFTWQDGTTNQTYLATQPGVYWAQVADFQGCTTRDSLIITESPRPATPVASIGDTVCKGETVSLSMNQVANSTYGWLDPNSQVISGQTIAVNTGTQPAGGYKAFVKVNGCESFFDTARVGILNPPAISLGPDTVFCNLAGTVVLDPGKHSAGLQYLWDNASTDSSRSVTQSGLYSVAVTNAAGCISTDSIQVSYQSLPISVTFNGPTTFCSGSTATFGVDAQPGLVYEWTGPNGFTATGSSVSVNLIQPQQAGTYTVTPKQNGCSGPPSDRIITVNASPEISLGDDTAACTAFSLVLDPGTHQSGFTYLWNDNSTDSLLAVSQEGTYTVQVSNGLCTSKDTLVLDFGVGPTSVTFTGLTTFCQANIGFFGVLAVPGETYSWTGPNGFTSNSNSILLNNIQPNQAGVYTVTPSTVSGCAGTPSSLNITVLSIPSIDLGQDAQLCSGGTRVLDPVVAGADLFYIWSTTATDSSITISSPGTYSVRVTSDGLCFARDTIVITSGPGPNPVVFSGPGSFCAGTDASFGLQAQANAEYNWTGPNGFASSGSAISIPSIQVNQAGHYKVVPSLNGCIGLSDSVLISVDLAPFITLGKDSSTCNVSSLTLDPLPHGEGVTYLWSTTSTDSSITINATGQFVVTISSGSCSVSDTINVIFGTPPAPVVFSGTTNWCQGEAALFGVNSVSGVQYSWTGPNGFTASGSTVSVSSIQANQSGFYKVISTSGTCVGSPDSIQITVNTPPSISLGVDQSICNGNLAVLDPTPHGDGLTYLWNTASTDSNLTVTTTGQYIVTVSAGTCSSKDTINVTFGTAPGAVVFSGSTSFCQGQNATFGVLQQTDVTYSWTGPNGFTATGNSINLTNIQLNQAGQYSVIPVKEGCNGTLASVTISITPKPVAELGNAITACVGTSVSLDPSPNGAGLSYVWSTTSTDSSIMVSASDTYYVTVTSGLGCSDSDTVLVTFTNPPSSPTISGSTVFCQGSTASFSIIPSPGASYNWTGPNSFTFNGPGVSIPNVQTNQAGVYTVTPSQGGCLGTSASITISIGPGPAVNLGADDTLCGSTPITLDPGPSLPGYTYLWNFGSSDTSITVNQSGEYAVTVSFGGCSSSDTVDLTFVPLPLAVTIVGNEAQCSGTNLLLDLQGTQPDVSYQWTGPNGFTANSFPVTVPSLTNSSSGTYQVTPIRDGCPGFVSFLEVVVNQTPAVNLGLDLQSCAGVSFTLDPVSESTGLTFQWNTGSTDTSLTVSQSGQYIVTVTSALACSASDTVEVSLTPLPIQVQFTGDSIYCLGENASFGVVGQFEVGFNWTGPNGFTAGGETISLSNIQIPQSGYYTVQPFFIGCQGVKDSIYIKVGQVPTVNLGNDTSFCGSGTYTISTPNDPALNFLWSTGDQTNDITVGTSGKYFLTATNSTLCSASDTVQVAFKSIPEPIVVVKGSQAACESESVSFEIVNRNGESYSWSGPNGFLASGNVVSLSSTQLISAGIYTVTAEHLGCAGQTVPITLTVNPIPTAFVAVDSLVCKGSTLLATAGFTPGSQLLWSDRSYEVTSRFGIGKHWLRVSKDGCSAADTFRIRNIGPTADFKIAPDSQIVAYEETHFIDQSVKGLSPITNWEWSLGFAQFQNTQNAVYTYRSSDNVAIQLIVKDQAGCSDTTIQNYQIQNAKGWFVPNVVTANQDGKNDTFHIRDLSNYPGTSVKIVDRWGKKLYESGNYQNDWQGNDQESGTYFYEIYRSDGQKFNGYLVLVK